MNAGKGSYVEVTVPYIVEDSGFVTKVKGQLMLVDATTSMSFRSLLECETLEVGHLWQLYLCKVCVDMFYGKVISLLVVDFY